MRKNINPIWKQRAPGLVVALSKLATAWLLATPALAQVNYAVSGGSAYVTNSPNASGNIVIASTFQGKPVISIGDSAFYYCASLRSVTIPNSVTSIGDFAFYHCSSLMSVTIPNSVTNIGDRVFFNCTSLTNFSVDAANAVYSSLDGVWFNKAQTTLIQFPAGRGGGYAIPNTVTNIGDSAFYNCASLTSVTIPNSVTSIGDYSFEYCASLTTVTIPNGVTNIGGYSFYDCTSLTSVTIPNSVTDIGNAAFFDCASLTSVTIPNSVTSIGYEAFLVCTSLTSVTIPNSVTNIGDLTFSDCTSLTSVTIPNSVTSIGYGAFEDCTSLTSVTIPNSVTSIGDDAFWYCFSLTSVTIPNSVTSIGGWAFEDCTSLTSVTFLGNVPSEESYIFDNVAPGAKVYYYYGTTGWGPAYGGLPTVMLGAPAPQVAAASAGVKPGGFGFTLNGVINQTIVVEASTNLGNPVWIPVGTNTLTGDSSYFSDPEWTNHPARFYRAVTP